MPNWGTGAGVAAQNVTEINTPLFFGANQQSTPDKFLVFVATTGPAVASVAIAGKAADVHSISENTGLRSEIWACEGSQVPGQLQVNVQLAGTCSVAVYVLSVYNFGSWGVNDPALGESSSFSERVHAHAGATVFTTIAFPSVTIDSFSAPQEYIHSLGPFNPDGTAPLFHYVTGTPGGSGGVDIDGTFYGTDQQLKTTKWCACFLEVR